MLNESIRNLHLLTGKNSIAALANLNLGQFRKKYPGEHVAIVRAENRMEAESVGLFTEIHELNLSYIQRSSFSPLLGDEVAFHAFVQALHPLVKQKWSRLFNLKGCSLDTGLSELFSAQTVIGTCARNNERRCQEPPLKLTSLLEKWDMGQIDIQQWLMAKTFGLLEWSEIEPYLQKVIDAKAIRSTAPLRNLIVGVRAGELATSHPEELAMLQQLFTVVDLQNEPAVMEFFCDISINGTSSAWGHNVAINSIDLNALSDLLPQAMNRALSKWACLSFLFDFLGNARAALAAERILTRYDRDTLQQFLLEQVLELKTFARLLVGGARRQDGNVGVALSTYWQEHRGVITFASAVELSLRPNMVPLLSNDQDLAAVKKRMRLVNQFYERLHRACALEIPKTDLELTL